MVFTVIYYGFSFIPLIAIGASCPGDATEVFFLRIFDFYGSAIADAADDVRGCIGSA